MKSAHLAWIIAAATLAVSATAGAGVYKWVDKDGKVRYGDQPPPDQDAQAREINTSAIPLALQERLRQLDTTFSIKRMTGNLETAWVCLTRGADDGREPAFVTAFAYARLGTIKQSYNNSEVEYDYDQYGSRRLRRGQSQERCPKQAPGATEDRRLEVYEIRFDPQAVSRYRSAP